MFEIYFYIYLRLSIQHNHMVWKISHKRALRYRISLLLTPLCLGNLHTLLSMISNLQPLFWNCLGAMASINGISFGLIRLQELFAETILYSPLRRLAERFSNRLSPKLSKLIHGVSLSFMWQLYLTLAILDSPLSSDRIICSIKSLTKAGIHLSVIEDESSEMYGGKCDQV